MTERFIQHAMRLALNYAQFKSRYDKYGGEDAGRVMDEAQEALELHLRSDLQILLLESFNDGLRLGRAG